MTENIHIKDIDKILGNNIMIFVPHEDDEINITGGLLTTLKDLTAKITIVFATNGDAYEHGYVRHKEALHSIKNTKCKNINALFLGYPDQLFCKNAYSMRNNSNWVSVHGKTETYGSRIAQDYCFDKYKKHHELSLSNFIEDISDVIQSHLPDSLFCVDCDSHPDHQLLSYAFEKSLGNILKSNPYYRPKVYKGFAYPTAYKGKRDFYSGSVSSMYLNEYTQDSTLQNPYYKWGERVRFPLGIDAITSLLPVNTVYKCLKCHQSQLIIKQYQSIINNDQIFWQRRTDNLLLQAKISASSGNVEYLNDFIFYENIHANHLLQPCESQPMIWHPDENDFKKEIVITFSSPKTFNRLTIYQNTEKSNHVMEIELIINGMPVKSYSLNNEISQTIELDEITTSQVILRIVKSSTPLAGFAELELFHIGIKPCLLLKIVKDNNFLYYRSSDSIINHYELYCYDGDSVKYVPCNEKNLLLVKKNRLYSLYAQIDEAIDIIEENREKNSLNLVKIINSILVLSDYCLARLKRKLRNTLLQLLYLRR